MLDIFKTDAFGLVALTESFIKAEYQPGQIGASGLFQAKGIKSRTAVVEWKDGQLALIQTTPRGGAKALPKGSTKRTVESFLVPHLERGAAVYADEVQDLRAFGSEDQTQPVTDLVNERLADCRADHEVTLEHMRVTALQGIVLDADGSTLVNLFTKFNVSQLTGTVSPNAASDEYDALRGEITVIQRAIEAKNPGPINGYKAYCGAGFFDQLRADVGVTQTLRFADPQALLQNENAVRRFNFAGVVWEEYRGSTGGTAFIADDEAYVCPIGPQIYKTYFAPADYIETVNTLGLPGYAKQIMNELGTGIEIHTQSNPLVLVTRPDVICKVTITT